ncbi:MAG: carboxypeptidase-like regulatory domain-containing protein [Bacteroidales bacterium]|jgi:hypothetical protein|nr:carboxypeptidase-like regulatory domain-containing protein [Bacteroidales bacterium]
MKRIAVFSAILLIAICNSCSKDTPDLFSTIHGIVSDHETGAPIETASIVLSPGGKTSVSGVDGRYEFKDLEATQYTVTVQKAGYHTNRKTVTAVAGESVQVDIPLTKIE